MLASENWRWTFFETGAKHSNTSSQPKCRVFYESVSFLNCSSFAGTSK